MLHTLHHLTHTSVHWFRVLPKLKFLATIANFGTKTRQKFLQCFPTRFFHSILELLYLSSCLKADVRIWVVLLVLVDEAYLKTAPEKLTFTNKNNWQECSLHVDACMIYFMVEIMTSSNQDNSEHICVEVAKMSADSMAAAMA